MSLITGDVTKRTKFLNILNKFGSIVSILAFLSGICFFLIQSHDLFVHRTYMSGI